MWTIWQNKHISKSITSPYKSRFSKRLFTQSLNAGIVLDFFEETGCGVERHIFHPFLVDISLHTQPYGFEVLLFILQPIYHNVAKYLIISVKSNTFHTFMRE